MRKPIDIRTQQPVEADEPALTPDERRRTLPNARLDAQFVGTSRRIHADLARIEPEIVASALSADSRKAARELIVEVRAWLDAFEQELRRGGDLRAV